MESDYFVDLHIHTNASDGQFSSGEIVALAKEAKLTTISITDHDSLAAIPGALQYGKRAGIRIISGIELTAEFQSHQVHVLGYGIDVTNGALNNHLQNYHHALKARFLHWFGKLNKLGISISPRELNAKHGPYQLDDIIQLMIAHGYADDFHDALEQYFNQGGKAYVPIDRISVRDAIELIHCASGVAVLAHPGRLMRAIPHSDIAGLIQQWADEHLDGLECYHTDHTEQLQDFFSTIAADCKLFITGGSDFHGNHRPKAVLGQGGGGKRIPYDQIKPLVLALEKGVTYV